MEWCAEYDTPLVDEGLITPEQCQALYDATKHDNVLRERRRSSSGKPGERTSLDGVSSGSKTEVVTMGADNKPWVRVLNTSKVRLRARGGQELSRLVVRGGASIRQELDPSGPCPPP